MIFQELKDHPAFIQEIDPTKPLPPLVEGIQQVMYNSDDAKGKKTEKNYW